MSVLSARSGSRAARTTPPAFRLMRVGRIRAILALCTVAGFGTVATLASFSDSGTQLSTFSSGSVDLKFDGTTSDSPTGLSTLTMSGAKPGAVVYKSLTINNTGSLALTYNLAVTTATTTTTDLATALTLSVYTGVTAANCAAGTTSGGTAVISGQTLNAVTGFSSARSLAATNGSDTLCFAVTLPTSAGNSLQSQNTSASFLFTGSPS